MRTFQVNGGDCHLSFVICHSSFVICHLSFVIRHIRSPKKASYV
ncbi:hypothetical protein [Coleofasciculus sp. F4-SAH-05]